MYFRPPGAGGWGQPAGQPPGAFPNFNFPFQNFNPYLQQTDILLQHPNFPFIQSSNIPVQNPHTVVQNVNYPVQSPNLTSHQLPVSCVQQQDRPSSSNHKEDMERIDCAVVKARKDLIEAGESVSSWKVAETALVALQAESWNALGYRMQEVPSLHRLLVTEGKINAFIHCYVGARRITSVYDLEVAICKNEGVEHFEELEVGPLTHHPLVLHYFQLDSSIKSVYKITAEEIISHLCGYMDSHKSKYIKAEEFLDFIAKKQSVSCWEKLGVRIRNLGMHIAFVREARREENAILKKYLDTSKQTSTGRCKKRPLFPTEKKQFDEEFSAISHCKKSFSSAQEIFSGKHIRFISSCSEDDDDNDDGKTDPDNLCSNSRFSAQSLKSSDQVSSCPYPSQTEEIMRIRMMDDTRYEVDSDVGNRCGRFLKCTMDSGQGAECPYPSKIKEEARYRLDSRSSPASSSLECSAIRRPSKKIRKTENGKLSFSAPTPIKLPKKDKVNFTPASVHNNGRRRKHSNLNEVDFSLATNSMRMFITTWKEACKVQNSTEVFERMLQFYKATTRQQKRIKSNFSLYPCIGLLNVAVMSIKLGMWDSIYDAFQAIDEYGLNEEFIERRMKDECIDVEPSAKDAEVGRKLQINIGSNSEHGHCVSIEDIMNKLATYFELDHEIMNGGKSSSGHKFVFLKKLLSCEAWLTEQLSIKEFKSLGYGEFFQFLEENASILPKKFFMCFSGEICEKSSLDVRMLQHQLVVLLSQASNNLWENESITKQKVSLLLKRQFPLIGLHIVETGFTEDILDILLKQGSNVPSKCVLFSATLCGTSPEELATYDSKEGLRTSEEGQKDGILGPVTSMDAIEVLLRAPMLSDLNSWSHWDLIFSPSLGPLVGWLLQEVNTKELLCVVTKDGSVIRLNHLATVASFLEASLQLSSFQAAVELISLFALFGGKKHSPLTLLKCHVRQAFEVALKNSEEDVKVSNSQNLHMVGKASFQVPIANKDAVLSLGHGLHGTFGITDRAVSDVSRFILDCLSYLPSEFCSFAADILLSGLRDVIKDAPSIILHECSKEQQLILHEVGLSLGIAEWIDDYHKFCSSSTADLSKLDCIPCCSSESCDLNIKGEKNLMDGLFSPERKMRASYKAEHVKESEVCPGINCMDVSGATFSDGCLYGSSELNGVKDAAFVIESIRREEFGLDPSLSMEESSMLSKQHARLGRALHCLSQELYSQDSHFLLELIQNADDNSYPDVVIPTLTFILHEEGIVVLNNERGFGSQNIRALCDVGNSTKKGSSTGYIGKKGIGFKSVFRVTDAPEIHSNGFHIKFDISEGQIGFVLPSFIPPCNIDLYSKLASSNTDEVVANCWNTCIVLPFRSKLSEGICIKSIISMFSDLHPSLLLFLHRLKCITFRNMLNDSLVVMRKDLVGNGIVRVSLGSEHMTWFVSSQTLPANSIRSDVQTTEISIAFTLKETDNGEYTPHLELQPVFAFLPLRTYGLKFILQGDFVLPSSREEVDGDSPWNQWLLSEFPGLFVSAERSFCALPCYKENPGKAISIYMSFVPLVGEVHGFFSSLPRMIISKLRISHCFLVDEDNTTWVPPCKVLRNWNPQARTILSDDLLHTHLGLGFLDKDIFLSDSLARALGVVEYGPKVLVQVISSLSHTPKGLESVGFGWLFSCLNELYTMCSDSSVQNCFTSETELDIIWNLQKAPFIPLSDGTYGAADNGTIWLHTDALACEFDSRHGVEAFPNLYGKLQIVTPALFSASANTYQVDNVTRLLCRIGCQALSAHEIIKVHILPAFSKHQISDTDKSLMVEYLSFVMYHLQSNCPNCKTERSCIISDLKNKALILTNHGYQLLTEVPIHFTKEYGNPIDVNKLFDSVNLERHEIDISYIKHSVSNNLPSASAKWREFFQELGVTDFVKVVGVHKNILEISPTLLKNVMCGRDPISHVSLVRDWECNELAELLSLLSMNHYRDKCIHMLDVLDVLWDDYFSDKVMGCCSLKFSEDGIAFKSSFIRSICDVQWIASSMDDELHSPQYLFHDCDAVRSILGSLAPYAIPKVRSEKLLSAIGFRTQVTINDVLETLKAWRKLKKPFKASLVQMSRLYTIISNEMITSRERILNELHSLSYIFVPLVSVSMQELSYGIFLSPNDVYWHDSTGSLDLIKGSDPYYDSVTGTHGLTSKMLCNLYPGLHDFFVGCGVPEIPHFRIYIKILLQLSSVCLPSQAAKAVFWIFVRWADGLRSGAVDSENMVHLKESLSKSEFTVFPTERNKWVSLDPSSGRLCWCNNETLRKEFENSNNIEFLSFGDLNEDEMELLQVKVSVLMQSLGIPAFSEVVTREAIYYGPADSSFKVSLVNWALPYLQRYMHHLHHDKYSSLKKSWFEILNTLQIIVVEKLFCRNVIAKAGAASNKRLECNSLLQGNILYTTQESDSHSLFMELSRLLFDGSPELPLANFLHMITTMVESGSSEAQTEFFILNTQKMPKLPGEESLWTLSLSPPLMEIKQQQIGPPLMINEQFHSRPKRKAWISDWPPADWKSAPDFNFTHAPFLHPSGRSGKKRVDSLNAEPTPEIPYQMDADWTIKDDTTGTNVGLVLPNTESMENQFAQDPIRADSSSADPVPNQDSIQAGNRDQLLVGEPNSEQAALTGRLGELLAYKYFARKGGRGVKWVNEISETGLPYDIVLEGATGKEYVEVKATKSRTKDWFMITAREWQFALEAGESFSIAHVVLSANNVASVAVLRNPAKLCQLGKLQLVVMMPKLKNEYSVVS